MKYLIIIIWIFTVISCTKYSSTTNNTTFAPLKNDNVPQTVEELWQGYDPRKEPLDVEILKEWEVDNVVMKVLRYRIGIFKGQKAMMAAIYGYPKSGGKVPGLVQIHGGGQYADYRAVWTNAKRGYATISIAWAGRINAPDYYVDSEIVKLFWESDTTNPKYKVTTDWGAVDGYHAPFRNSDNSFEKIPTASWTLDSIASPRNNSWFLCTVGARRALTFLEQQPEVNPDQLGVYGHSMGGKLTVMTAIDSRVKAAAPSCGGVSDRYNEDSLFRSTLGDDSYLKRISCPILFLSPANDFHGRINDLQKAIKEIQSDQWRITCSPHHNHQDTPEYEVTTQLWFDQHLKGVFKFPQTPKSFLELSTDSGIPSFSVTPDIASPILYVDVYYTQQGNEQEEITNREQRMNRFWHYAHPKQEGDTWTANLPLLSKHESLWVYANVVYSMDEPITGAGYYYSPFTSEKFNLSSTMSIVSPKQLQEAGVQATMKPSLLIETFRDDWEKEWFTYEPDKWGRRTHKVYNEKWKAPVGAKLSFEVQANNPNKLVVEIDNYAVEVQLQGGSDWQQIILSTDDFHDARGNALPDWKGIKELRLTAQETLKLNQDDDVKPITLGAEWNGLKPEFRNLCWVNDLKAIN